MAEKNRPVYCTKCGSIVQPGDNFCGVCGARVTPEAQDAAPTEEIPTQVYPPPRGSHRGRSPVLTVVLGLGAVLVVVVAVGAIFAWNLLGSEAVKRDGTKSNPAATTPPSEGSASHRDEGPQTLGVGDSVEVRGR